MATITYHSHNLFTVGSSSSSCMVEFTKTLTWSGESDVNISQTVTLSSIDEEFEDGRYEFDVYRYKGAKGMPKVGTFTSKVNTKNNQFSIPNSFLRESDLKPGQTVRFIGEKLPEDNGRDTNDEFVDSAAVLDRVTPTKGGSNSDNISSSLNSQIVYDEIGDGKKRIRFRNTRNEKAAESLVERYDTTKPRFQFPYEVRRAIDAELSDVIELSEPTTSKDMNERLDDIEDKLSDMEQMLRELYDAYKNND